MSFGGREWKPGAAVRGEERQDSVHGADLISRRRGRIACMVRTRFPGDEAG